MGDEKQSTSKELKEYVWVSREYNSNGQSGKITCTFKAESLEQLDAYLVSYTNGNEHEIPKSRIKVKSKIPKDFYLAGGFCSDDISFTCATDGTDMSEWWNSSGFGFIEVKNE